MANENDLEQRLVILEREVAELKRSSQTSSELNGNWRGCLVGDLQQFPEWQQVSQTGKKLRNQQADYTNLPPSQSLARAVAHK